MFFSSADLCKLPLELILQIVEHTGSQRVTLARLPQCCTALYSKLNPVLWGDRSNVQVAMRWACKNGRPDIIDLAVANGAPPSAIDVYHKKRDPQTERRYREYSISPDRREPKVLSIYLAVKHKQIAACVALLRHGARIFPVEQVESSQYVKQLGVISERTYKNAESKFEFARVYFRADMDEQIKHSGLHRECKYRPLVPLIQAQAPFDVLKTCLERMEEAPTERQFTQKYGRSGDYVTALTASILHNSPEMMHVLFKQHVEAHEDKPLDYSAQAFHLPIFAAASALATRSWGEEVTRICLDYGVDANTTAVIGFRDIEHKPGSFDSIGKGLRCKALPLDLFLASVASWEEGHYPFSPYDRLLWLLANRFTLTLGRKATEYAYTDNRFPVQTASFEIFLRSIGLSALTKPGAYQVARTLLQQGAATERTAFYLIEYTLETDISGAADEEQALGLQKLIDLLLDNLQQEGSARDADVALWEYLSSIYPAPRRLTDTGRDIVDRLMSMGADINACSISSTWQWSSMPALHYLCRRISRAGPRPRGRIGHSKLPKEHVELFRFMLDRGADPDVLIGGMTASEMVLANLDEYDEETKQYLNRLARMLRKTAAKSEATPDGGEIQLPLEAQVASNSKG